MADFYLFGNTTGSQMLGGVITSGDVTLVIDGGTVGDAPQLAAFLETHCNSHVDGWFFTHPHHDHIGAFCELCLHSPSIKIDCVYHAFPDGESLCRYENRNPTENMLWKRIRSLFDGRFADTVHVMQKGERFAFGEFSVSVLRVYNPGIYPNFVNNSSSVLKIESQSSSMLILGDLGVEGGEELMRICTPEELSADYTQMAHHGQNGVSRACYEYIRPKRCVWAAPDWLWDNNAGNGFDTGPWKTVQTRAWMDALGVTAHFVEKDGLQRLPF